MRIVWRNYRTTHALCSTAFAKEGPQKRTRELSAAGSLRRRFDTHGGGGVWRLAMLWRTHWDFHWDKRVISSTYICV